MKPLRLSWSQLRVHEECTQKSHLMRSGKKAKATNLRNYFHGMVVDKAMRDWLMTPTRTTGEMIERVTDLVTEVEDEARDTGDGIVRWKDARDKTDLTVFCIELVTRLEPILRRIVLPYRFEPATRFAAPIVIPGLDDTPTEITLIGETDLIVYHDDGLQVWDLKGTKDDSYWRKTLGQLYFYDLAMLAVKGQRTERVGLIQPMCEQPVMEFQVTDDDRASILARVVRMAHDIWAEQHQCKTSTSGCNWCEVRHACPRFQITDDLGGDDIASALRAAAGGTT